MPTGQVDQPVIPPITVSDAAERAARAAIEKAETLRQAMERAEARIADITANPQLSPTEKENIIASLRSAMATGNTLAIHNAVTTSIARTQAEAGENNTKTNTSYAMNTEYALDAAAQARIDRLCRNWDISKPKELRNFTNAFVEESDPQLRAYLGESLAKSIETEPDLNAAARMLTTAPKTVLKKLYTQEEQDRAMIAAMLKKFPEGTPEHTTFKKAEEYFQHPAVHKALQEYAQDPDIRKLEAAIQPAEALLHKRMDRTADRLKGSANAAERQAGTIAKKLGGAEEIEQVRESLTAAEIRQADANIAKGVVFKDEDSREAIAAAVERVYKLSKNEYKLLSRGMAAGLIMGKDMSKIINEFDAGSADRKVEMMHEMLKADPQASALLKGKDAKTQDAIVRQYVEELETNKSHFGNSGLDKGIAAVVVREAAEQRGVHLDGKSKVQVAYLLGSEGFTSITKGNKEAADMWAEQVENAMARNGFAKPVAVGIGVALKTGSFVGTGITNAAASLSKGTAVEDAKKVVSNVAESAMDFVTQTKIKLQERAATGTAIAAAKKEFDLDGDGKLSVAEIGKVMKANNMSMKQFDTDKDGKIDNSELVAMAKRIPDKPANRGH